jgi:uncharacterized protein GlcG (DUF336 family)
MTSINLAQASGIVDAAIARARELELTPIAVVVLDAGGNVCLVKREDDAGILRVDISHAKAWGTLGLRRGGGTIAENARKNPVFFATLATISGGRIATSRGGVLIRDENATIIGAIGVSGAHAAEDEACAVHGIEAVGLVADAG